MIVSPIKILKTIRKEVISFTELNDSQVRITVTPFLPFDWFPSSITIFPHSMRVRRSDGTDGTAFGAMAAAPIQQLTELHFGISIKTFGGLDEVGTSLVSLDDIVLDNTGNELINKDSHVYLIQRSYMAINGLYIKKKDTDRFYTHGSVAIVSVEPIGKVVEPTTPRRGYENRYIVESIINCYVVFEPLVYPEEFIRVVEAE